MMASMSISMGSALPICLARDRLVVGGADNEASGASLEETLEPCSHRGSPLRDDRTTTSLLFARA